MLPLICETAHKTSWAYGAALVHAFFIFSHCKSTLCVVVSRLLCKTQTKILGITTSFGGIKWSCFRGGTFIKRGPNPWIIICFVQRRTRFRVDWKSHASDLMYNPQRLCEWCGTRIKVDCSTWILLRTLNARTNYLLAFLCVTWVQKNSGGSEACNLNNTYSICSLLLSLVIQICKSSPMKRKRNNSLQFKCIFNYFK